LNFSDAENIKPTCGRQRAPRLSRGAGAGGLDLAAGTLFGHRDQSGPTI